MRVSDDDIEYMKKEANIRLAEWGLHVEVRGFAGGRNVFIVDDDNKVRQRMVGTALTRKETHEVLNVIKELIDMFDEKFSDPYI